MFSSEDLEFPKTTYCFLALSWPYVQLNAVPFTPINSIYDVYNVLCYYIIIILYCIIL